MNQDKVTQTVRNWLESIVIDLDLCPFAKREYLSERVRFAVSPTTFEDTHTLSPFSQAADVQKSVLQDLVVELALLNKRADIETSLLILPDKLLDFDDYVQFLDFADELLVHMNLDGVFQIASFHPDYCFADSQASDVENYTNRSPYPILHILREASIDAAVEVHPNTERIPMDNQQCMRDIGLKRMRKLLNDCYQV